MDLVSPAGISANEYTRRIEACRHAAGEAGLDALIAYSHSLKPGHVLYLTGYVPFNGAAVVLVSGDSCRLFTDADWDLAAARSATWLESSAVDFAEDFADGPEERSGSARQSGWRDRLRSAAGLRLHAVD